jgi:nitrous oxidase accessory protein NosD
LKIKARKGSVVLMSVVVVVALLMGGLTSAIAEPRVIEVPEDYPTIQDAVDFAAPGDKIIVGLGEYSGAIVNKPVEIVGEDGAAIVDGPPYDLDPTIKTGFFLEPGISSDVTISGFTFFVDLPVFGRSVDDVTVKHNIMNAPLQGVTSVRGSRWVIKNNDINGLMDLPLGGIGIWIVFTDIPSLPANDNLVAFNKITGDFPDPSGFIRAGIGLSSWGG